MKPGVYAGVSNADYHGGEGVSKSMLDVLADRSPLHLHYMRTAANDNERQPTPAQRIGTMFHALLLEPDEFDRTHVLPCVIPEGALVTVDDIKGALKDAGEKVTGTKSELTERLKAVRPESIFADEVKQQFAISNAGRTIMTHEEWEQLRNMRDAVMAHPAASALLSVQGWAELSAFWVDGQTGELCRCRPDFWRKDGVLVDVKTTEDASPEEFARSIANWRYHVQHAMYVDGITETLLQASERNLNSAFPDGIPPVPKAFVFLAVEKSACVVNGQAKGVAVYVLDEESVRLGGALYHRDLGRYAHCNTTGVWPGYGDKLQSITLPAYEFSKNAQLLEYAA
jgi:hypothetical protein